MWILAHYLVFDIALFLPLVKVVDLNTESLEECVRKETGGLMANAVLDFQALDPYVDLPAMSVEEVTGRATSTSSDGADESSGNGDNSKSSSSDKRSNGDTEHDSKEATATTRPVGDGGDPVATCYMVLVLTHAVFASRVFCA